MKILLDTHIFLWAISEPENLGTKWRHELETMANTIYVSSITVAEIMIKSSIGKLDVHFDPVAVIENSGFEQLDFRSEDAVLLKEMPFHHRDPFDRMLIAQSIANKMRLMSDDKKFSLYSCKLC